MTRSFHGYLSEFDRPGVYRAEGIFWVRNGSSGSTSIEFLNYWLIKRAISEVAVVATVRDLAGSVVARQQISVAEARAFCVETAELLSQVGVTGEFEGSIDVEIFSTRDLRFAYPALLALYEGDDWRSVVHTYARQLSISSGDDGALIGATVEACESNWTVWDDAEHESFLVFHNGPFEMPAGLLRFSAWNQSGERLNIPIELAPRSAYCTTRIAPGQFADLGRFLAGKPGWAETRFEARGVLPRLLAGTLRRSDGAALSVTHSHVNGRDREEVVNAGEAPEKPMFVSVPVGPTVPWRTRVIAFPTHPPTAFDLTANDYAPDGRLLNSKCRSFAASDIGWRATVLNEEEPAAEASTVDLGLRPHDGRLPMRFHLGVSFTTDVDVPCTFTTGFAPFRKPRYSTYWFPILNLVESDDYACIINTDNVYEPVQRRDLELTLFRCADSRTLQRRLEIGPNGGFVGSTDELFGDVGDFLEGDRGWCLFRSSEPANLHVFYGSLHRRSRRLAADHAF